MDRPVILRHLQSSPLDPFTRRPLDPAQLLPDPALQARIRAFVAAARPAHPAPPA